MPVEIVERALNGLGGARGVRVHLNVIGAQAPRAQRGGLPAEATGARRRGYDVVVGDTTIERVLTK
eukprot:10984201-Alexandrium_andersonii.AAC.1